jgi:predicted RNase H-like HicB family nuclease
MASPHAFTVIYEPAEDGGFYAHIPALDVTTEGETLAKAKEMARDAIENVLAFRRQLNLPIPEEVGCETIEVGA